MFTSNTAEVIDIKEKRQHSDVFSKILDLHKRLKEIAQYESISSSKPNYKVVKPTGGQLQKIKALELNLGYKLVAYQADTEVEEDKLMILNRVNSLLDEFLSISKNSQNDQASQAKKDDFNEFFEQ